MTSMQKSENNSYKIFTELLNLVYLDFAHSYKYICIHIHVCVFIHTHTHTHTHIYIYIYIYVYTGCFATRPTNFEG